MHVGSNKWLARLEGALPWLTPFVSSALAGALVWLGSDVEAIKQAFDDEDAGFLATVHTFRSVQVSLFLACLTVLSGVGQFKTVSNLRKDRDDHRRKAAAASQLRSELQEAEETIDGMRASLEKALWENTSHYLRRSVKDMNFSVTERVSLYTHADGSFLLAGRYSEHPDYCQPRRRRFSEREGCIGKAWFGPSSCQMKFPDPKEKLSQYLERTATACDMDEQVASQIRMKSRHYIARALQSQAEGKRVGVIVFESETYNTLNLEQIEELVSRKEDHLANLARQSASVSAFLVSPNETEAAWSKN